MARPPKIDQAKLARRPHESCAVLAREWGVTRRAVERARKRLNEGLPVQTEDEKEQLKRTYEECVARAFGENV